MNKLDRTEQRIVGVLIEKALSVPDTYPMSENALVDGCNQKNNRDPLMDVAGFQIAGALMSLHEKGWAARVEGSGRVAKFKHRVVEMLEVDNKELAVFAELLLRGPQAPGALKTRVQRMGNHGSVEDIEAMLRRFAEHLPPLVELLPLAPREQQRRWRHLLGDGTEQHGAAPLATAAPETRLAAPAQASVVTPPDLVARVSALERQVAELIQQMRGPLGD